MGKRREELLLIEQRRQEIEQEKQNLAQMMQIFNQKNNDLKAREARLLDIEPLVPSVRELQSYGITFDLLMPFLIAVNEKSVLENISPKTAAYDIISELRDYRELGHLQGTVKRLKEQISALDAFDQQKQRAVTALLNLQSTGFSEMEIVELTLHVSMWSAQSGMATLSHINGNNSHGMKLDDKLIGVGH